MKAQHKPRIKVWLLLGRKVTPKMAWTQIGCYRLSSVINRLRNEGMKIETDMSKGYATYSLDISGVKLTKAERNLAILQAKVDKYYERPATTRNR